ncbi:hypothetical protein TNCV_1270771 [Trichonephila clavipes]|nr:hypothetical protein TNCV_1270771 [Trichonephila clavipes]
MHRRRPVSEVILVVYHGVKNGILYRFAIKVVVDDFDEVGWEVEVNHFIDQSIMPHFVENYFYIQKDADGGSLGVEPMDDVAGDSE